MFTATIIGPVLVLFVALGLWQYIRTVYRYFADRNIPFVPATFPLGSFGDNLQQIHYIDWIRSQYGQFRDRDKIFGLFFCTAPRVVVTDLDTVADILDRDYANFVPSHLTRILGPLSGNLITMEGEKWRLLRTKLSPAFSLAGTRSLFPSVSGVCADLVAHVGQLGGHQQPMDAIDVFMRYSSDVICLSIFGLNTNSLSAEYHGLTTIGKNMFEPKWWLPYFWHFMTSYPTVAKFIPFNLIPNEDSAYFIKSINDAMDERERSNVQKNDFLDLIIRIRRNGCLTEDESGEVVGTITPDQLIVQSFMVYYKGFFLTRTSLSYLFYELARNENVQEKLRSEIRAAESNDYMSYDKVESMAYLQQVYDETLRKHAPAKIVERRTKASYRIRNSDHVIDAGMQVQIPVSCIHNDPETYPDPDRFDPDRMTAAQMKARHPCSFMPFGYGHRGCMATRPASLYAKMAVVALLARFKFTVDNRTQEPFTVNPLGAGKFPVGGIWLNVQPV